MEVRGRHRCLHLWWWPLLGLPTTPPRGAAIDVFNFGGGRCRKYRQHLLGGPPSISSTSMVVAARNTDNTPYVACHRRLLHRWWPLREILTAPPGACHRRRLQLRWWLLSEIPTTPLEGPSLTSSTLVVAAVGNTDSTP
jgi:hypothetical protein